MGGIACLSCGVDAVRNTPRLMPLCRHAALPLSQASNACGRYPIPYVHACPLSLVLSRLLQLAPLDAWVAQHLNARRAGHALMCHRATWLRCVAHALHALHALPLPPQATLHVLGVWVRHWLSCMLCAGSLQL